jgi:hypothetical protein
LKRALLTIAAGYSWEHADVSSKLPKRAVQGGCDASGEVVYVGRAMHNGFLVPARIVPSKGSCFVGECQFSCLLLAAESSIGFNSQFFKVTTALKIQSNPSSISQAKKSISTGDRLPMEMWHQVQ